ncbi:MAG: hypothetical protein IJT70_04850 [Clostridia bacterium]|nr:hypothetical protein [Clostridia bacterium]
MNETPDVNFCPQPEAADAAPAEPAKKSKRALFVAISIAASVLLIAGIVFFASVFSANSRFRNAMEAKDYAKAEELLKDNKLNVSEKNDAYYLALADHYLDDYNKGKGDYENTVRKIIDLRSVDLFDEKTGVKIADCEKTVIEEYIGNIYDSYCEGRLDYDDAVRQIKESDIFDDDTAEDIVNDYVAKADEKRDEFYTEAIMMITDLGYDFTPEDVIEKLESFGDYRNAKTLIAIFNEIEEGNGVEAAKLLSEYDVMIRTSNDVIGAEQPSNGVFEAVKEYILNNCFETDSSDDSDKKLDLRLGRDYTEMMFDDDSGKITTLCGNETSRSLSLGKDLDLDWFSDCKGGTGKVLYLAHYLSDSSYEPYDMFYYYRYENVKDIPLSMMPESLEDVEYLVVYDEGGDFYADYSTDDGIKVEVYQRTIRVTVRQFPSGKIIYDSGTLKGPKPPDSFTVSTGTKFAYGEDPDLTAVIAKVKQTVGIS